MTLTAGLLALSSMIGGGIGVAILALVIIVYVGAVYNKLVMLKERYKNGFAQIEVQLKRRYDLIPNLVETAKGYMKHEQETLLAVVEARNAAATAMKAAAADPGNADAIRTLSGAEGALMGAMQGFNVVVEQYPDLKANQNMLSLQEELTSTENKVAFSRQSYNDIVTSYNTYRKQFPPTIFAGMFGHHADAPLLEFEDSEAMKTAPKIQF